VLPHLRVPTITTDRLRLRGWRDDDLDAMAAINLDVEVAKWLGGVNSRAQTLARMEAWVAHWQEHGFGQWAIEELEAGRLVGRVGFTHHDDWTVSGHDAEIGWVLAREAWGRGYATEAARAALDWALQHQRPNLETIISITRPDNVRSRRVMEKLGLTYRGATTWRGFDQVWYA
jgi:RimJ/RimL family protein N-acetyltransferase